MRLGSGGTRSFDLYLGYGDVDAFKREMARFVSECDAKNVFVVMRTSAADPATANTILSIVQGGRGYCTIDKGTVALTVNKMFGDLTMAARDRLAGAVLKEFSALDDKKSAGRCTDTILKNAFVRVVYALKTVFFGLLENQGPMFYEGDLGKYDFIALNILASLGVSAKVVCLKSGDPEFLTEPLFGVAKGSNNGRIDFAFGGPPAASGMGSAQMQGSAQSSGSVQRNEGFRLAPGLEIGESLDLLSSHVDRRKTGAGASGVSGGVAFGGGGGIGGGAVGGGGIGGGIGGGDSSAFLSISFGGAGEDIDKYAMAVNKFYLAIKAKRGVYVMDESFANPSYDEVQAFNAKGLGAKSMEALLSQYAWLAGTPFPAMAGRAADAAFAEKGKNGSLASVYKIWLARVFGMPGAAGQAPPAIVVWGAPSDKASGFLRWVEVLPVDIIQFSYASGPAFSANAKRYEVGKPSPQKTAFPYEARKLSGYATVAFQAEQEIRGVLSGDDTLYYQMKQFRRMNPIILKTTFEEIDIIWKEPAKLRPSFSTAGGVVTIPSIFAKINGVPDSMEDYKSGIQAKMTPQTLLLQKFPFMPPQINPEATEFMKRIYYGNAIDVEKLKRSKFYTYSLFSQETQNVVIRGINDFVGSDWYIKKRSSFIYDVLEILFRMPHNVIQLIHNFSFTEAIPKVVAFNPTKAPCEAADCILILFLKSMGFDVIIYVPTGYRVVEEYIGENLFNSIEIGQYRYDLEDVDAARWLSERKSILKNLFNRKGTQR